ncbi:MAG: recombination-associated protein RdgC [Deltaproteobacteria bacterium]|nr:recombination-associated protein RdgC [Deltaproteobacteria bacterium]
MGLLKGSVSLTRYRVTDDPPELTDEFISDRLKRNAFLDIESTTEEESIGWVETLDPWAVEFNPINFNFGRVIAMGMRRDHRKISAKVVNRYAALAQTQAERLHEQPLTVQQRRVIKAKVRQDLLARTPVNTDVFDVCWLVDNAEVWLVGTGTKVREYFEDLWRRTFGLSLMMKIPFVLSQEFLPKGVKPEILDKLQAADLNSGGLDHEHN